MIRFAICLHLVALVWGSYVRENIILSQAASGCNVLRLALETVKEMGRNQKVILKDTEPLFTTVGYASTHWGSSTLGKYFGILPIEKNVYEDTKNPKLSRIHTAIMKEFCIDWKKTTYYDLKIPLYSVIAAQLVVEMNVKTVPAYFQIRKQLEYWVDRSNVTLTDLDALMKKVLTLERSSGGDNCFYCHPAASDTLLIFDTSQSISEESFQKEMKIGINILRATRPESLADSQAAVMLFSKDVLHGCFGSIPDAIANLTQYSDSRPFTAYATNTAKALSQASMEVLTESCGFRAEEHLVTKNVIIFTDGVSDDSSKTLIEARALHKRHPNVNVLAIGIGEIKPKELLAIASNEEFVQRYNDFEDLVGLIRKVLHGVCEAQTVNDLFATLGRPQTDIAMLHAGEIVFNTFKFNARESIELQVKNRGNDILVAWSYTYDKPDQFVNDGMVKIAANSSGEVHIYNPAVIADVQRSLYMSPDPTKCPPKPSGPPGGQVFITIIVLHTPPSNTTPPPKTEVIVTVHSKPETPADDKQCSESDDICLPYQDQYLLCFDPKDGQQIHGW